jgi:hypothetical protein
VMDRRKRFSDRPSSEEPVSNLFSVTVEHRSATVIVPSDRRPTAGATVGLIFAGEGLHLFDSTARSLLHNREDSSG